MPDLCPTFIFYKIFFKTLNKTVFLVQANIDIETPVKYKIEAISHFFACFFIFRI